MTFFENEWYIQAPWGRICVISWGDCFDPPVLLCHGIMDSAASYRPLIKLLPRNFYYIGMEIPGNGKSDPFPPGLMISLYDLAYVVEAVARHFRWDKFAYIGHSMGAAIGKMYNTACPGKIEKLIEIDLINFYGVPPDEFPSWYKTFYTEYFENFEKYNSPRENAPTHMWSEAIETLKKSRGLTDETASATLERYSEPAGDGLIRYTHDPRLKLVSRPPFSPEHIKQVFTNVKTPTLDIVAQNSFDKGLYVNTTFLLDEKSYPAGNYRMRPVPGGHDVHIVHPERVALYVGQFLLHGLEGLDSKAKL